MDKNKVCRTCLSNELLNPIFPNLVNNEQYSTALELTTGLKITYNDGLPQVICTKCVNFINKSLEFRLQCKQNELELLKYYRIDKNNICGRKETIETEEDIKTFSSEDNKINQESIIDHTSLNENETIQSDICEENFCSSNNFIPETTSLNNVNEVFVDIDEKNENSAEHPNDNEEKGYCMIDIPESIPVTTLNNKQTSYKIKINDIKVLHPNSKVVSKKIKKTITNQESQNLSSNKEPKPNNKESINSYFDPIENDKNKITCKLCAEIISKKNKIGHLGNQHRDIEIGYEKCDICYKFIENNTLEKHKMISHGFGKKYVIRKNKIKAKCVICNKTMLKNSLNQHILLQHSGMAPVCEHCGLTFGNKSRLQDHYRAKHGYEKYKCGYCTFESAIMLNLKNHERLHTGEKPYVCHVCGDKFHAAYLLRQHQYLHTTEYNYKCDQCPAKFKSGNNLRDHISRCHSSEKINCSICDKKFSSKIYAQRHIKRAHKSDLNIS